MLLSNRWPLFVHTRIRSLLLRPSTPRSFIRSSSIWVCRHLLGMIGLDHPSLQCQMRRSCQWSSPYQMRRSEQSHHMIPLLYDLFMFFLLTLDLWIPSFSCFINWDWMYYLNIMHNIFLFWVIHIYYHFWLYSLFSLLFCLWNMWFKVLHTSCTLRLCLTQEVPLPPFIFNRSWNIEVNVQLGWGESWERKFCY